MVELIAAMGGLSVALLVLAVASGNRDPRLAARLERLEEDSARDPYERPFSQRVLAPLAGRVVGTVTAVLPTRIITTADAYLETAGSPLTLQRFLLTWSVSGVILPGLVLVLASLASGGPSRNGLLVLSVGTVAGLGVPWLWLRRKARQRSRMIARSLPDAVDLIVANIEAGLGLQAAMLSVSEKDKGPVGHEFSRVVRDVSVGRTRAEALTAFATRSRVPDVRLFTNAVVQAERTGISIGRVLRSYAQESRARRRMRAREQAAKLPIKITVPTGIFIFPTLLLVVLGPMALRVMEVLGERV